MTVVPRLSVLPTDDLPLAIINGLDVRDVALWVLDPSTEALDLTDLAELMRLPWNLVLSETGEATLLRHLEEAEPPDSAMVRQRGLVHIVETNPADVILPPRCLPILLLNGRNRRGGGGLGALTRRLTMIEELRRRSIRHLVIVGGGSSHLPAELSDLWADGYRALLTVVSDDSSAVQDLESWVQETGSPPLSLVQLAPLEFSRRLVDRYRGDREGRVVLRIRDAAGQLHRLDVSALDDPEHPILGRYELLTEESLLPLMPDDLTQQELEEFFKNVRSSWRPFAAGVPWTKDTSSWDQLRRALGALDREAPTASRIFYVQAESGAGATTFVRNLAWNASALGYPTLVAGPAPFTPNGLEVTAYLNRVLEAAANQQSTEQTRLYQVPWLIVFDKTHWDGREEDLIRFSRELERSGRRACFIMVTGPQLGLTMMSNNRFEKICELSHQISQEQALSIGRHLNRFLKRHGGTRTEGDWRNFFEASATQATRGIAAFWIALSFWLQRQFDMSETVQSWIYRQFREKVADEELRQAIVGIAAMSTVHQPFPDALFPPTTDWPISDKLGDIQSDVGSLGLVRIRGERDRYWAMLHDLLGRYLLTALFYDFDARSAAGFAEAQNPEHLRFMALRQLSALPALDRTEFRDLADAFAVSIFKIDPDHGHGGFVTFWREALAALDGMPRGLRMTSRTFLHHAAISRRRIAKDMEMFPMSSTERVGLLERAVTDIETALNITADADGDTDLSLFNSLAHGYHDLAEAHWACGAPATTIGELRAKAREATRRAYQLSPDDRFVVETYARDLISEGRSDGAVAAHNAIEVLSLVYSLMERDNSEGRRFALSRLAEAAFDLLFEAVPSEPSTSEPQSEADAIARALQALVANVHRFHGMELNDYPQENRVRAANLLSDRLLLANPQAVKLRYLLTCLDEPRNFDLQLELLQSLSGSGVLFTPQLRLEFAVLLHQLDRHHEADQLFRGLRRLWRQGEHYVQVPTRLHWLLTRDRPDRRQVQARVSASGDGRYFARVREMNETSIVFRPQEFGQERLRPGMTLSGYVSFGYNGPFLRPLTAAN